MTRPNHLPDRRRRPGLETLEGRALLSLAAESPTPVNTKTSKAQFDSANAGSANGSSVVVWVDAFSTTDHDIRAQRFDPAGNKAGPEITVSASKLDEKVPAVAMDSFGNFIVAWTQTQTNGDTNVVARRFNAVGRPVGGVVPVGVGTFKERDPSIAMDNHGDFVVAYTRETNNNNPDVFAKTYGPSNQLKAVVGVDLDPNIADHAKVAMTPDGRFDVGYEHAFSASNRDIILKQCNAAGALSWTDQIANGTTDETHPGLAMDNAGNAVVVWQRRNSGSFDVLASRASASGQLGSEFNIEASSSNEMNPSVAMKRTGGDFVVTYDSSFLTFSHAHVAEASASNQVTVFDAGARTRPAVSLNGTNRYLVTYTSNDNGDQNIRRRTGELA